MASLGSSTSRIPTLGGPSSAGAPTRWAGLFADDFTAVRRLVLVPYAVLGPVYLSVLYLLAEEARRGPAMAVAAALLAIGALVLLTVQKPSTATWAVLMAIFPAVLFGISALAAGGSGTAFQTMLAIPALLAALFFERPVVQVAVVAGITSHLVVDWIRKGPYPAVVNAVLFGATLGLIAWIGHRKATALRRAREERAEEARRTRALLDALPDAVMRADAEGRFLEVHVPDGSPLPDAQERLVGRRFADVAPPEVSGPVLQAIAAALRTGEVQRVEYTLAYPDGLHTLETRIARAGPGEVVAVRQDITARRRADQEQREHAALVSAMDEAVVSVDPEGRIRTWSPGAERITGYAAGEAIGKEVRLVLAPGLSAEGYAAFAARLEELGRLRIEEERTRKDGSRIWAEIAFVALRDAGGRPAGHLAVARDVSARRAEQAELAAAKAKLEDLSREQHLVLQTAQVGLCKVVDRRMVWMNQKMEELFGYSREAMLGQSTRMLYPDDETHRALGAEAYPVLAAGRAYQTVRPLVRRDGRRIWVSYNGMLIDPSTPSLGTLWVLEDVTLQREARERLRESEERLHSIFESMPEGVVLHDATGRVVSSNAAAERILGLTRAQLEGRTSTDPRWRAVQEDGSPFPGETHPAMVTLRTGERHYGVIMGVEAPDGARRWISISSEPLGQSPGRSPYAVVATFTDVTELRIGQEALRRSEARLERVVQGSAAGTFDWNLRTGEVARNSRLPELLGLRPEEFAPTAQALLERLHPEDAPGVGTAIRDVVEGRSTTLSVEFRLRAADGSWRWFLSRGVLGRTGPDGDVTVSGTISDMSERHAVQERVARELFQNEALLAQLRESLAQVQTLTGLVPVCMHCNRIRDDQGYWDQLEAYVAERTGTVFSHGLCPECLKRHYPGMSGDN